MSKCYLHLPGNQYNQEVERSEVGSCIDFDLTLKTYDFILITDRPLTDSEYIVARGAIEGYFVTKGRSLKRKKFEMGLPNDGKV